MYIPPDVKTDATPDPVIAGQQYAMERPRNPFEQIVGGRIRGGEGGAGGPPRPANQNVSQEEVRRMIPEPLTLEERAWQNYGRQMHPDDVMKSESVWGGAKRIAEQHGISEAEGFAHMANDLWKRMGANRYMSPEMAKRYMRVERARMMGIKSAE